MKINEKQGEMQPNIFVVDQSYEISDLNNAWIASVNECAHFDNTSHSFIKLQDTKGQCGNIKINHTHLVDKGK